MAGLAFSRSGAGAPLVLLHGIGMSRRVWDPVIPSLAEQFDVLAVDLPGFGDSQPMPAGVESHPAALAAAVAEFLDGLGIVAPNLVGNSLGGWVALELADIRPASSLTLLSPAGLWPGNTPLYCRISLRATRWLSRHGTAVLSRLVNHRPARALLLAQTYGRPSRMSAGAARAAIRDMATCPGFDAALDATAARHYVAGSHLDAPVTVAFGSRDHLLLGRSRGLDQLPAGTRVEPLPGCGHVPMSDDPDAVTALIRRAVERGRTGERPASPGGAVRTAG